MGLCITFCPWCMQTWISSMCYVKCGACNPNLLHQPRNRIPESLCGISAWPSVVTLSSCCLHPRSCGEHDGKSVLVSVEKRCTIAYPYTNIVIWVPVSLEESGEIWYVGVAGSSLLAQIHADVPTSNQVPNYWRLLKYCLENTFPPLIFSGNLIWTHFCFPLLVKKNNRFVKVIHRGVCG